ncbi:hypothetical protein NQ176_g2080 [Zarea fungicola]|uniref:Uncharacterized protein n=1 Tax=Zarea fungicola TaxID=93591 RepID=A0ACC1NS87_9HYPO|nr:hypothetical protein NQ176_g2080 [Lecanicillium fungicola]
MEAQPSPDLSSREPQEPRRRRPISQRRRDKRKHYLQELETIVKDARHPESRRVPTDNVLEAFEPPEDSNFMDNGPTSSHTSHLPRGSLDQVSMSDNPTVHETANELGVLQDLDRIASQFEPSAAQGDSIYECQDYPNQEYVSLLESIETDCSLIGYSSTLNSCNSQPQHLDSTTSGIGETTPGSATGVEPTQILQSAVIGQGSLISSPLSDLLRSQAGVVQNCSLEDILMAGIQAISSGQSAPRLNKVQNATTSKVEQHGRHVTSGATKHIEQHSIPDIHMNTIHLTSLSFVAACAANAEMVGVSVEALFDKNGQSPFFKAQAVSRGPPTNQFSSIKPLLRPSAAQLDYPHHPYLDVLPFPAFRSRIIQLLQIQPLPFDPADLCHDLRSDGCTLGYTKLGTQVMVLKKVVDVV